MCDFIYKDSELVIGLVAPVGVDTRSVQQHLETIIKQFGYNINITEISKIIEDSELNDMNIDKSSEYLRIDTLMSAGNKIREKSKNNGILAMYAIKEILDSRKHTVQKILKDTDDGKELYIEKKEYEPLNKCAHIIRSLKTPDEALVLRRVYSTGFFLLGISSSKSMRMDHLKNTLNMEEDEANKLIERDEHEVNQHGQHMRDVFHIADAFIDLERKDYKDQLTRIIELIFGNPFYTPFPEEYGMFFAYASSLRSADLSRQVGAVIMSEDGEIISTGTNDVPKFGGGLYGSDDDPAFRDIDLGEDSNEKERNKIILQIMETFGRDQDIEEGKKLLRNTGVLNITEYGRAVHAEMEAILSCLRSGRSPLGATLFCTTFPCHNCAKHIVASGIKKVIYIEPYPKSQALNLHSDSICHSIDHNQIPDDKVVFKPFVGIAHRRFIDLFSINKGAVKTKREENGKKIKWVRDKKTYVPLPLLPISYIEREQVVYDGLKNLIESSKE